MLAMGDGITINEITERAMTKQSAPGLTRSGRFGQAYP
jgi:hypothetical protein